MDHDLFPPAVTVTSGQRLVLSRGNGSLKSSCMVKLVESDWLEPQLAERGSSESDAAEFSSLSLLQKSKSLSLSRGRMNDELVWLDQSCRSFLQTSAALFSVDKLLHIDVALYSGGSLLENHKLDTLRFFIVRLPQQIHENGLSITLVVNFNMISTHTRVKAAADRRAKRLAPLIRH